MLPDKRQDQVGRNRGDLVEARFAELALDVIFGGEAEAAKQRVLSFNGEQREALLAFLNSL